MPPLFFGWMAWRGDYVLVLVGIHFHRRAASKATAHAAEVVKARVQRMVVPGQSPIGQTSSSRCWKSVGMRPSVDWRGVSERGRGVSGMTAALLISALLLTCAHGQGKNAGILRFSKYWPIINGVSVLGE